MRNIKKIFKTIKQFFKKHRQAKYEPATVNVAALAINKKASKADKLRYIMQHTKKFRVRKKLRKRIKKLS